MKCDERIKTLAKNLINFSCSVKKGEKVLIEATGVDDVFVEALIEEVYKVGAYPFVELGNNKIKRRLLMGLQPEQVQLMRKYGESRMKDMDAYIGIRGGDNAYELADVPSDKMSLYSTEFSKPVHHELRVKNTKWCVLRYPTEGMSELSGMSTEAFEDLYFNVCKLDYQKMDKAMDSLVALMNKTDKVRITAKDTDLTFSIKGIPAVKCSGHMNIPDGEVYTAPVRDSVNGVITYNTPSVENVIKFEQVKLTFKDGKIIDATANYHDAVNKIFDTDEGARYVGEFAFGVNPYITKPMCDILFDEKISGSLHFTPGSCYDDAFNGNDSAIHWDLVLIQTPEYGGGDVYFDDVLIRRDGRFVLPELECLNPENLK